MDTSNFKAGNVDASGTLNTLSTQLNKTGKDMVSFASVASGAGQLVRGNFEGALFGLLTKLKGIPPMAAGVVVALAGIGAAAYQVAKAFGVSTGPVDRFFKALSGKPTVDLQAGGSSDDIRQTRRDRERREREGAQTADARELRQEDARAKFEASKRKLEGAIRGESPVETAQAVRDIEGNNIANQNAILERQLAERQTELVGTNDPKRAEELAKQIKNLEDQLAQNARELELNTLSTKAASAMREQATKKATAEYEADVTASNAQFAERASGIGGRGINTDQMARVGGFVGPARADLGIADRAMKIQIEAAGHAKDLVKLAEEHKAILAEINGKTPNAGGQL
jgi:hypothetical protein